MLESAEYWINKFAMKEHPGGCGYFIEIYRSEEKIISEIHGGERCISSTIYSLMQGDNFSQLHQTKSSQTISYFTGTTEAYLHTIDDTGNKVTYLLGNISKDACFQVAVKPHIWFVIEPVNKSKDHYILTGHTVSPGFEMQDFLLANREQLSRQYPHLSTFITQFSFLSPIPKEEPANVCYRPLF